MGPAFTLIELLVVIVIIGILAALLLPVFGSVQNKAHGVQALNDIRNVKTSIVSYYSDYRHYPVNATQQSAGANGSDSVYGDSGGLYPNSDLFDILRAQADNRFNQNNQLNPSQTVYWNGNAAANPSKPRSGITTQDVPDGANTIPKGSLVDPWGKEYIVWVDVTGRGDLTAAASWFYSDIPAGAVRPGAAPLGLEFGSLGPDGMWGTKKNYKLNGSDDIVTWDHS